MSQALSRLSPPDGARHKERRVGRGVGSTKGQTCGRGNKGQKARSGGDIHKLHFEGGQTPLQRRLPKRGFRVPFPVAVIGINVGDLDDFASGSTVDEAALREVRLVQGRGAQIKILGDGELSKKLTVIAHKFSASAKEAIEKAGGKVVVLESSDAASE
jgi:large subunit ribosomal protein L15